jgi:hypothetical protein
MEYCIPANCIWSKIAYVVIEYYIMLHVSANSGLHQASQTVVFSNFSVVFLETETVHDLRKFTLLKILRNHKFM